MEPSSVIKVVGAFVAGVVVALGSALVYVRVSDMAHPPRVTRTEAISSESASAKAPVAEQSPADTDAQTMRTAAEPGMQPSKPKLTEHANKATRVRRAVANHTARPKPPVVEVAQNSSPGGPLTPAANGDQIPTAPEPAPPEKNPEPDPVPTPAPAAAPEPHTVTLPAGTSLPVRLAETLSSDHNYTGDTFRAVLESPIIMDGFIIADKGSKVLGRIVNVQKPGRVQGVAGMTLALSEINTTDGQRVGIDTSSYVKQGQATKGEDAAKIAGGAALGAIIGAIAGGGKGAAIGAGAGGAAGTGAVLMTHGKPAVIPVETKLTFQLTNPVTITEKLNQ